MGSVDQAFKAVPRKNFVLPEFEAEADIDEALPIGFGQTISQPYTVGKMLEWLEAGSGDKVLDVGSGSGWSSALLAHIVGPKGQVYAVEIVPELVEFGRKNVRRLGLQNVSFHLAHPDIFGLPEHAPYDAILVSAEANEIPVELLAQLKVGGKLVVPVGYDILEVIKTSKTDHDVFKHAGFIFVPLIK